MMKKRLDKPNPIRAGGSPAYARKLPWATTLAVHSFETLPGPQAFGSLIEVFSREGARPA